MTRLPQIVPKNPVLVSFNLLVPTQARPGEKASVATFIRDSNFQIRRNPIPSLYIHHLCYLLVVTCYFCSAIDFIIKVIFDKFILMKDSRGHISIIICWTIFFYIDYNIVDSIEFDVRESLIIIKIKRPICTSMISSLFLTNDYKVYSP